MLTARCRRGLVTSAVHVTRLLSCDHLHAFMAKVAVIETASLFSEALVLALLRVIT